MSKWEDSGGRRSTLPRRRSRVGPGRGMRFKSLRVWRPVGFPIRCPPLRAGDGAFGVRRFTRQQGRLSGSGPSAIGSPCVGGLWSRTFRASPDYRVRFPNRRSLEVRTVRHLRRWRNRRPGQTTPTGGLGRKEVDGAGAVPPPGGMAGSVTSTSSVMLSSSSSSPLSITWYQGVPERQQLVPASFG